MTLRNEKPESGVFSLKSELLSREISYYAHFPENCESSSGLSVLYLLHGLFGHFDNWLTNTNINEYARERSFIIICPDGGNTWYADSQKIENHFYESYFFDELFEDVERRFNAGESRKSRAIAGLSMGGYGAFKFAFRRPEMFCFAASMSGAFHAAEIFGNDSWTELQPSILEVFGDGDSGNIRAENDLFQIAEKFPSEQIGELPFFYFDCGTEDSFLPINIRLAEIFSRRGIAYQFEKFSGGHDWDYWNAQLETALRKAEEFLR